MRPAQLGELINAPSLGKVVKKMINQIPRLLLEASIQPLTRGLLRMDLILTPDFQWEQEQHGYVEPFLILVRCTALPRCIARTRFSDPRVCSGNACNDWRRPSVGTCVMLCCRLFNLSVIQCCTFLLLNS